MKRKITIVSCLLLFCLGGLFIWGYVLRTKQSEVAAFGENTKEGQLKNETPIFDVKLAMGLHVIALPVRIVHFDDDQFSPCYLDPGAKTLYRWKGVFLRRGQIPAAYKNPYGGVRMPDPKNYTVELIDVPVKYREINRKYYPGYLDHSCWVFYQWKGVEVSQEKLLDKSPNGQGEIVKPHDKGYFIDMIEIDMPTHLKDHPELWKKK